MTPARTRSPFGAFVAAALLAASVAPAFAQSLGLAGGSRPEDVLTVSLAADADRLVAGKPFRLALVAVLHDPWHVNSHTPSEDYLIPTAVSLGPSPGLAFREAAYPAHQEKKFAFSDRPLAVYEGRLVFRIDGVADPSAATGPRTLTATIEYQACNDQQCLAPAQKTASLSIDVAAAGSNASAANAELFVAPPGAPPAPAAPAAGGSSAAIQPLPAVAAGASAAIRERWSVKGVPTLIFLSPSGEERGERVLGFLPPDAFLKHVAALGTPAAPASAPSDPFAGKSLPLILGIVFLSGLALNLTPCVYPLIPITVGFFGRQSDGKSGGTFRLALLYVLGMSVTYSALGVFAALSGSLFGAWLQKPAVLVGIAAVVVALALSMFGLFEIQAPHFITDRTGSQTGALGALTMGLFVGFVAAPCIGPFVLSLLTFVAAKGSALFGFGLFFTLAMGLGLPYLVLGTASGSLRKLPRSGEWMVVVKKVFGFVLLALAVYFLRPILSDRVYELAVAAVLAAGAVYLLAFEKSGAGLGWFRGLKAGLALGLLAGAAFFAMPRSASAALAFEPYSEAALAKAKADGRPVMIDAYADWCLPCKELDHKTFNDARVVAAMKGWTLLKADLTK